MIAFEIEGKNTTIRIHDEFYDVAPDHRIQHLNRIVTDHYKRKYADAQISPSVSQTEQTVKVES